MSSAPTTASPTAAPLPAMAPPNGARGAPPERPGPPPWWAWALAVVSVIGVLTLVVAGAGAAVSALSQRSAAGVLEAGDVRAVQITATSAAVTIIGDDTVAGVSGEWSTRSALLDAGVTSTVRDGVMTIAVDCPPRRWFGPDCEGELTVRMPPQTQLTVDMETASLSASALSGDIDASVNAGSMRLRGLSSQTVRASNNAGEVDLRFDAPPRTVIASTNVGTVTVQVPDDGTTYAVSTSSNVGEDSSDVPSDVRSTRFINASTNVGTVDVTTRPIAMDDPADAGRTGGGSAGQ